MKKPTWGLVLSGGAAYSLANAGILEVLEREGLRPDYVAGSSMGAIIGALHALGKSTGDLRQFCDKLSLTSVAKLSDAPFKGGLHGGLLQQSLREHLQPMLGDATIDDCPTPFVCIAGKVQKLIRWTKIFQRGFAQHAIDRTKPYVFDGK